MKKKRLRVGLQTLMVQHVILCCILFVCVENGLSKEQNSTFSERPFLLAINRAEGSSAYTYLNMIYREVFNRLGIPFKLRYVPLKRGALESDSGTVDGETSRVYAYGDAHPNLIRVTEYLYSTDVSAYATNTAFRKLDGWQSLEGSDFKVEYPRGVILSETNLTKVVEPQKLSSISSAEQGLHRLLLDRIDIYIDDDLVVVPLLKSSDKFENAQIYKVGPMESVALYMYIHKKNSALEPQLSKIIKEVRDEGLMEKYRKVVFGF